MEELSAGKFVEKNSRFYAHLYLIASPDEPEAILEKHHKEYGKANHHCWGMIFQGDVKFDDDGEVGRPGRVILQSMEKRELDSHVLVISRVFGGTKLGVGGVSRAFRKTAEGLLNHHFS